MKLKYYGTGAGYGIPEIFCDCRICRQAREEGGRNIRTRSCATLDERIAIDLSVDTFYHSAFAGLDMRRIKQVLVTHAHHDHFFTNDMFSRARNMSEPVNFYLSEVSGRGIRKIVESNKKAFEEGKKDPEAWTKAEVHTLRFYETVEVDGYTVTPLRARHDEAIEAMNFVISREGKSILWAHDTGRFHSDAVEWLKASGIRFDLVSLDCTLRRGAQITTAHMDIDWCVEMAELLRSNGNADGNTKFVLSHIGHLVDRTHAELEREAAEVGMIAAYDGMEIEL